MEHNFFESDNHKAPESTNATSPLPEPHASEIHDESMPGEDVFNAANFIKENIQYLLKGMSELKQDFDVKIKYDESKEVLITNFHKELQFYRDDFHFRVLKPLFVDLISLYDDLGKFISSIPKDNSPSNPQLIQHLVIFQDTIEEILHRNGVDSFTSEQETFLSGKQRNTRVIPTSDPALDKHIAKRIRPGFEYNTKLLRPEIVETYKYTPPTDQ